MSSFDQASQLDRPRSGYRKRFKIKRCHEKAFCLLKQLRTAYKFFAIYKNTNGNFKFFKVSNHSIHLFQYRLFENGFFVWNNSNPIEIILRF